MVIGSTSKNFQSLAWVIFCKSFVLFQLQAIQPWRERLKLTIYAPDSGCHTRSGGSLISHVGVFEDQARLGFTRSRGPKGLRV